MLNDSKSTRYVGSSLVHHCVSSISKGAAEHTNALKGKLTETALE